MILELDGATVAPRPPEFDPKNPPIGAESAPTPETSLGRMLAFRSPGDPVVLTVQRGAATLKLTAILDSPPPPFGSPAP